MVDIDKAEERTNSLEEKLSEEYDVRRNGLMLRVEHNGDLSVDEDLEEFVRTDYISDGEHITTFVPQMDELDESVIF